MIRRVLEPHVLRTAAQFPVVTITGPRQAGKTTLCRALFPQHRYASLEDPDVREHASSDPRGFLAGFPGGAVLDEVQRVPDLASYLQTIVDRDPQPGRWILTGSQHFGLLSSIAQSLAGRTAILHLLPPSLDELGRFEHPPRELLETLWTGAYPRIHDQGIDVREWLRAYVATYVERDVRSVLRVSDLTTFQSFVALVAGRTAQVLSLSGLGADAGIDHKTAAAWLTVLEASFILHRLPPFHRNLGKRWIKAPKLHFFDSGLLCYLLGIREPEQLRTHPLRGFVFETWVVAEIYKARVHRGIAPDLMYWRESKGVEVDLVVSDGQRMRLVEAKAGATVAGDSLVPLRRFAELLEKRDPLAAEVEQWLVYGGAERLVRENAEVLPWGAIQQVDWARVP
jgi:predicted AAA+ superfamily ATPase